MAARETGLQYDLEEGGDVFFILTNADGAKDFKIMTAPVADPTRANWKELVPHEPGRLILSLLAFKDFLVRLERKDGLPRIVVRDRATGEEHIIAFDEEAYSLGLLGAYEYDTDIMRFSYSSMTTPAQVFDYDMRTRERMLLKTQEVPSGHDPDHYVTRRLMAPSHDGELVPISLIYHRDTPLDGSAPCLLYGYGSYGITIPAAFNTNILSLADRGFVYAIAHVRGGKDKGFSWYEDGKREKKTNTFLDFIAAARHLVAERLHVARPHRRTGRLGRRHADGRRRQHGARCLRRHHRRSAVRRRADDDARRHAAAHPARMARMGQSDRLGRGLPDDRRLLALRQCRRAGLSADPGGRRPDRPARHLLGAGEMGRAAARPQAAATIRCCSRSTWMRATPARRVASRGWRRSPSSMLSR